MPLLPKLGAFVGQETRIPYDYPEVLGMIAPRPVIVFTPKVDYHAILQDVKRSTEEAAGVYDLFVAKGMLKFEELDDYNHFSPETQAVVFERLRQAAGF
jgi:hypothetical protein